MEGCVKLGDVVTPSAIDDDVAIDGAVGGTGE